VSRLDNTHSSTRSTIDLRGFGAIVHPLHVGVFDIVVRDEVDWIQ
jgi:hypothetical protein